MDRLLFFAFNVNSPYKKIMTLCADDFIVVYVTVAGASEARALARGVLEEKLAACANLSPMHSLYHWEGAIAEDDEYALIFKTRKSLFSDLHAFIKAQHDYTCPCIVALPLVMGDADYLAWIVASTKEQGKAKEQGKD